MLNTEVASKVCKKCGTAKPVFEYFAHRQTADGYSGSCKKCTGAMSRKNYQENRARYIAQHRSYYHANRDKFSHLQRESNLRQYGMTAGDYDAMLLAQGGVCALCGGINADGRRLAVDHDHDSGEVRGLLCGECNQSLGKMKDSPALLRKAAEYIEKKGKL